MSESDVLDDWEPVEVDTTVAHSARVYDYWLGGKDNFPADRELAEQIIAAVPNMRAMARANRDFLAKAVGHLVTEGGIRQFLDVGTGIPTAGNTFEVAQALAPESRVLYVDNDPIVLAHARAMISSHPAGRTSFILGDLREPADILAHPVFARIIDRNRPIGLLLIAVLMLFKDAEDPWAMVRTLIDALPSGSYVALTHPTGDFAPEAVAVAVRAAEHAHVTLTPRSREQVGRFLTGLELVGPGVVPVLGWGEVADGVDIESAYYYGAVARKP
ncbi:SAM-dependent methyltransferase [Kitasatospora sp. NBC_01287]|uniref:SAM-dependent methyltransferase n=1 Tax=Kitasatospora sp. NBC_01287 TaxID=2903573 RepID=UPI002258F5E1|nr:SAM-dependent methyltransferase [Kitasatospora sp. NBC_01287]MCX4745096.1 SAM-dependent methyltransferase [Kitasatospora sp. NBC_01287]